LSRIGRKCPWASDRKTGFNLAPQKLLHVRAALFRQIEIADKLARELAMPELRALLADMAEEVRRVFQPNP
jgi:hypothetical protein